MFSVRGTELMIDFNIDGTPIEILTNSPITQSKLSPIYLVSIFTCSCSPHNPVYTRHVDMEFSTGFSVINLTTPSFMYSLFLSFYDL